MYKKGIAALAVAVMMFVASGLFAVEKAEQKQEAHAAKKAHAKKVKKIKAKKAEVFVCPMKCEGEKTYAQPGKCPKCGMNLEKKK